MSVGEYHLLDLSPAPSVRVTVVRETRNEDGDPFATAEHVLDGCRVALTPGAEDRSTGERVVTTGEVRAPHADADVRAVDRVRLPGDPAGRARWTVEGEPARSPFPGGGCVFRIERQAG